MSEYAKNLCSDIKLRYCDKVKCIDSLDPYTITEGMTDEDDSTLPKIGILDIQSYVVFTHSAYTTQQLKAYKSLEAYKYYKSNFVSNVRHIKINIYYVVLAKVKHSQKLNQKELHPWIILCENGSVKTAHCDCMAGLGEVCSHITAVLFYLYLHESDSLSCTETSCKWTVPPNTKKVQFKEVRDMNWSRQCLSYEKCTRQNVVPLEGPSLETFLNKIFQVTPNAAVLHVIKPFADQCAAIKKAPTLPRSLGSLIRPVEMLKDSLEELRRIQMHLTIRRATRQRF